MNTIPHITLEQATAIVGESLAADWVIPMNRMIDAANAVQEIEYITAEQARELGAGKAEWRFAKSDGVWCVCGKYCEYLEHSWFGNRPIKYRAVKQAQPEPVDPHAALRAEYAKQVKEGTLGNFVWSFKNKPDDTETECVADPVWSLTTAYFCTPKSEHYVYKHLYCMVAKQGEPAKRMTRDAAKKLWDELGHTVEWFSGITQTRFYADHILEFDDTKDGKPAGEPVIYTYAPKQLKVIKWSDMPVGVAVQTVNKKLVCTFVGMAANNLISIYNKTAGADDYRAAKFELAPASEQPWIAVQGDQPPLYEIMQQLFAKGIETCASGKRFKVTGIAKGYVLEGAV
jgi:hypothetical protein